MAEWFSTVSVWVLVEFQNNLCRPVNLQKSKFTQKATAFGYDKCVQLRNNYQKLQFNDKLAADFLILGDTTIRGSIDVFTRRRRPVKTNNLVLIVRFLMRELQICCLLTSTILQNCRLNVSSIFNVCCEEFLTFTYN